MGNKKLYVWSRYTEVSVERMHSFLNKKPSLDQLSCFLLLRGALYYCIPVIETQRCGVFIVKLFWHPHCCCCRENERRENDRTHLSVPNQSASRRWCYDRSTLGGLVRQHTRITISYPETRTSPGGYLHRAWSFGIRPGRHAHEPGSSSERCCCNGSVG